MSPISPAALKANATERLCTLAKPKKDHQKPDAFMSVNRLYPYNS